MCGWQRSSSPRHRFFTLSCPLTILNYPVEITYFATLISAESFYREVLKLTRNRVKGDSCYCRQFNNNERACKWEPIRRIKENEPSKSVIRVIRECCEGWSYVNDDDNDDYEGNTISLRQEIVEDSSQCEKCFLEAFTNEFQNGTHFFRDFETVTTGLCSVDSAFTRLLRPDNERKYSLQWQQPLDRIFLNDLL